MQPGRRAAIISYELGQILEPLLLFGSQLIKFLLLLHDKASFGKLFHGNTKLLVQLTLMLHLFRFLLRALPRGHNG